MDQKQISELIEGDEKFKPEFQFEDLFSDTDKYVSVVNGRKTKLRDAIFKEFERCYSKWRFYQLQRLGIKPSYYRFKQKDTQYVRNILTFLIDNKLCHYTFLIELAKKAETGKLSNQYYLLQYIQNENVLSSVALDIKKASSKSKNRARNSYGKSAITSEVSQNKNILSKEFPALDTDAKVLSIMNLAKSIKNGSPISASKKMMEMANYCINKNLV